MQVKPELSYWPGDQTESGFQGNMRFFQRFEKIKVKMTARFRTVPNSDSNLSRGIRRQGSTALLQIALFVSLLSRSLFPAFETLIDVDARTRAMGNANTAVPMSGSVISGNPSLLSKFVRPIASLTVLPRGLGLDLQNISLLNLSANFILPLSNAGGVAVGYNGYLGAMNSDTSYNEFQMSFGYGVSLFKKKISVGAALLLESWEAKSSDPESPGRYQSSLSPNLNVGIHFQPIPQLGFGVSALRIFGTETSDRTNRSGTLPRVKVGAAIFQKSWLGTVDVEYLSDFQTVSLKPGVEFGFGGGRFHFGAGFELQIQSKQLQPMPSIGAGVNLGHFVIDYALAYPILLGGAGNHVFTLTFAF